MPQALTSNPRAGVGSAATEYVFNAGGQRVSEWSVGPRAEIQGKYYWGGQPVAFYTTAASGEGAAAHFEHQDWLGTERMRTTYNGGVEGSYTSLPWGDGRSSAGADYDANHYATLDHDAETDTDHAQFRQYSDPQGRWLSADPYGGSYDASNPQSFNRYAYAGNSPLSATDPTGLYLAFRGPGAAGSVGSSIDPNFSFDPGGTGAGLSGYFMIPIPTATWVYGQEVPYGPYIPGHWEYGWTWAILNFSNGSLYYPSVPSPAAPNNGLPCLAGAGPLQVGQSRCASPKPGIFNNWPLNGNLWPGFKTQDGICSPPMPSSMNSNPAMLSCCQAHDNCYTEHRCNASSWLPAFPGPCKMCNVNVAACLTGTVF